MMKFLNNLVSSQIEHLNGYHDLNMCLCYFLSIVDNHDCVHTFL